MLFRKKRWVAYEEPNIFASNVPNFRSFRTPVFCDWAFMKHRGEAINKIWKKIPTNIDILVTHGPPLGIQ